MKVVIETPRLRLREMARSDLDFVAAMLADPEVMRFYPHLYDRREASTWIERNLERYALTGHGRWLVEARDDGRPVGQVGLIFHDVEGVEELEVAYMIDRSEWRRGFATEAAAASRDHAFDVLRHPRVISLIRPENVASKGVAEKIGMTTDGRFVPHAGLLHHVYSVSRAEP